MTVAGQVMTVAGAAPGFALLPRLGRPGAMGGGHVKLPVAAPVGLFGRAWASWWCGGS